MDPSKQPQIEIAVIGGGISGAVCARELARLSAGRLRITVFDQGRGLGGRACHRRVEENGNYVASDLPAPFAFDHGCQFFRADSHQFREELLKEWLEFRWAAEWKGRFGVLSGTEGANADFFGFPKEPPYFCGVGGMSALPIAILQDVVASGAVCLRSGVRVASTVQLNSGRWLLSGTSGRAAFHDTAEEEAARASPDALGEFDAVVVTDVSASMAGWHRASAGIPEGVAAKVRGRTRVVLFTALFAFEQPLNLEFEAFSAADEVLWFASRTRSKPGLEDAASYDCWTLVSTPKYAAAEVERVPMQDPETGAFRPQDMSYLREGPCSELLEAFRRLLHQNGHASALPLPQIKYVGGQRWGSAFPAPAGVDGRDATGCGPSTVEVLGVAYDSATCLKLAPGDDKIEGGHGESCSPARDFLADDEHRIFYASDYVSSRLPGVEAAALSALDTARHMIPLLLEQT